MSDLHDKCLGSLVGGAVGDALGYKVEFMSLPAIRKRFGENGITDYVLHNGVAEFSDDTQMLLFTAEVLLNGIADGKLYEKDLLPYIAKAYEYWYYTQTYPALKMSGSWQEVHISSEAMIRQSQLGCVAERNESNIQMWIEKFRKVLHDSISGSKRDDRYMEDIITAFYNDDIQVFTPKGNKIILPQGATIIDFAYEVHTHLGDHAKYARINSRLEPIDTPLTRGDVVEVFTVSDCHPEQDWESFTHTFKARKAIRRYLESVPSQKYCRCPECNPIPGEEVIGTRNRFEPELVTVHKRNCSMAISLASSFGDDVVSVDFKPDETLYPVVLKVRAVDRNHLFVDLVDCITNTFKLSMESFNTKTNRNIVVCMIRFGVHSYNELRTIINHISSIDGVDEVRRLDEEDELFDV